MSVAVADGAVSDASVPSELLTTRMAALAKRRREFGTVTVTTTSSDADSAPQPVAADVSEDSPPPPNARPPPLSFAPVNALDAKLRGSVSGGASASASLSAAPTAPTAGSERLASELKAQVDSKRQAMQNRLDAIRAATAIAIATATATATATDPPPDDLSGSGADPFDDAVSGKSKQRDPFAPSRHSLFGDDADAAAAEEKLFTASPFPVSASAAMNERALDDPFEVIPSNGSNGSNRLIRPSPSAPVAPVARASADDNWDLLPLPVPITPTPPPQPRVRAPPTASDVPPTQPTASAAAGSANENPFLFVDDLSPPEVRASQPMPPGIPRPAQVPPPPPFADYFMPKPYGVPTPKPIPKPQPKTTTSAAAGGGGGGGAAAPPLPTSVGGVSPHTGVEYPFGGFSSIRYVPPGSSGPGQCLLTPIPNAGGGGGAAPASRGWTYTGGDPGFAMQRSKLASLVSDPTPTPTPSASASAGGSGGSAVARANAVTAAEAEAAHRLIWESEDPVPALAPGGPALTLTPSGSDSKSANSYIDDFEAIFGRGGAAPSASVVDAKSAARARPSLFEDAVNDVTSAADAAESAAILRQFDALSSKQAEHVRAETKRLAEDRERRERQRQSVNQFEDQIRRLRLGGGAPAAASPNPEAAESAAAAAGGNESEWAQFSVFRSGPKPKVYAPHPTPIPVVPPKTSQEQIAELKRELNAVKTLRLESERALRAAQTEREKLRSELSGSAAGSAGGSAAAPAPAGGNNKPASAVEKLQVLSAIDRDELSSLRRKVEELSAERDCTICMDRRRSVVYLPCSHVVSCLECSLTHGVNKPCPVCRSIITSTVRAHVYT